MVVVITNNGFLTVKEEGKVQSTDTIIYKGTEEECIDKIHGKKSK
jgi:hypothetical protein